MDPVVVTPSPTARKLPWGNLQIARFLIRFGLAFVYTYAAILMSLNPDNYAHYVPDIVATITDKANFLHAFGAFEVLLSIWLLTGKWSLYSAIISTLTIASLTLSNVESFSVLFRNVSIILSSTALIFLSLEKDQQ